MKFTHVYYTMMERLSKRWCGEKDYSLSQHSEQQDKIDYMKSIIKSRNAVHKYRELLDQGCQDMKPFSDSFNTEYAPHKGDRRSLRKSYFNFLNELSGYPLDPRSKLILFLGARCCKCKSTDIEYLEIDHIIGDGWEDRQYFKEHKINIWSYYLLFLEEAAEKLQLLCIDCHRIKTKESGDAWHRRPQDTKLEVVQN